jgi:hypothetical protein
MPHKIESHEKTELIKYLSVQGKRIFELNQIASEGDLIAIAASNNFVGKNGIGILKESAFFAFQTNGIYKDGPKSKERIEVYSDITKTKKPENFEISKKVGVPIKPSTLFLCPPKFILKGEIYVTTKPDYPREDFTPYYTDIALAKTSLFKPEDFYKRTMLGLDDLMKLSNKNIELGVFRVYRNSEIANTVIEYLSKGVWG